MSRVSQDQGEKKEKVERTFMGQKTSQVDIKAIMEKKSKYHASVEDLMSAEQDFYFSVLEKREEAQTKMDGVMKADAQVVTCKGSWLAFSSLTPFRLQIHLLESSRNLQEAKSQSRLEAGN